VPSGRYLLAMNEERVDRSRLDEWMHWQPTQGRRFGSFLLTPARVAVGIGAILTIISGLMPWAQGRAPGFGGFEDVFFSGLAGQGDGVVLILVSLGAGLLTMHRTPAESRVRIVRLLPAILVVLAALTWLNGLRASNKEILAWHNRGGAGDLAPGLWLGLVGILLMAVGSAVLLPEVVRWRHRAGDPEDIGRPGLRDVAEMVGGGSGIFVGGWLGILVGISISGTSVMGTIALGAVFGGLFGAYAGAWLGRTLVDRLRALRGRA
jgi:hypothetical protein